MRFKNLDDAARRLGRHGRNQVQEALAQDAHAGERSPDSGPTQVQSIEGSRRKPMHTPGVMNHTETRMAWRLEALRFAGLVKWWEFEPFTVLLTSQRGRLKETYTPDFRVRLADGSTVVLEIKGDKVWAKDRRRFKWACTTSDTPYVWCRWSAKRQSWSYEYWVRGLVRPMPEGLLDGEG